MNNKVKATVMLSTMVCVNALIYVYLFADSDDAYQRVQADMKSANEFLQEVEDNKSVFHNLTEGAASPPIYVKVGSELDNVLYTHEGRQYLYNENREYLTIPVGLKVHIGEHVKGVIVESSPGEFKIKVEDLLTVSEGLSGERVRLDNLNWELGFVSALDEENRLVCLTIY